MQQLSPREADILEVIRTSIDAGVVPSVREICARLGIKSTSTVHRYLTSLQEKGYILREDNLNRSIRLPHSEVTRVPVVGAVAAGQPILAEEVIEDYLPVALRGDAKELFALRVRGDSMINVGIFDGDLIVARRCETAPQRRDRRRAGGRRGDRQALLQGERRLPPPAGERRDGADLYRPCGRPRAGGRPLPGVLNLLPPRAAERRGFCLIRAIFFDIDGTLVSFSTHRIPESTWRALDEARRKGVLLFIATGRHTSVMQEGHVLGDFPYDGYITLNGQYCYTREGMVHQNCVPAADIRALVELLDRDPFPCLFMEKDRIYANRIDDNMRSAHKAVNLPLPEVADYHRALHHDVYQLNFFLTPEEESYPLSRMPGCAATRWSPYFSDITPRGGSKRIGIEKMLAHFGIPASDTMAFGDGGNDIEMLRFAGVGVAMGNAGEEVRQAADYVTDDVDHDGIQNALRRFGVI